MEHPPSFDDGRPPFDHDLAKALIGKHVLVSITQRDAKGQPIGHKQFHGVVASADPQMGFHLKLRGELEGQERWLPPDTRSFAKARPGEYEIKATGELVEDPDYTCAWSASPREEK